MSDIDYITLDELSEETIEEVVQYCKEAFYSISHINRKHSSYGLKQRFTGISGIYLTSRQFMQAMEMAGFRAVLIHDDSKGAGNWRFNISERSPHFEDKWLKAYWQEDNNRRKFSC